MTPRRRVEMVVEQDEILVVRRRRGAVRLWCNRCEAQVSMLRVEDASALTGTTARTIYRWVEAGKLHFTESEQGAVLVCAKSLATLRPAHRTEERKAAALALDDLSRESEDKPGKR